MDNDKHPYDVLYPALGMKIMSFAQLRVSAEYVEKHFKPEKLKNILNTVVLMTIGDQVWTTDDFPAVKSKRDDYYYEYDGFEFCCWVYKRLRKTKRIIEVHMSNDGFFYGNLSAQLVKTSNVRRHDGSDLWDRVHVDVLAMFKPEFDAVLGNLQWNSQDVVVDGLYNRQNMRMDLILFNVAENFEITFCFEPGYPVYDISIVNDGTKYSEIQQNNPATNWGKRE